MDNLRIVYIATRFGVKRLLFGCLVDFMRYCKFIREHEKIRGLTEKHYKNLLDRAVSITESYLRGDTTLTRDASGYMQEVGIEIGV